MLFHEAGHFLVARLFRIRVTQFALGIGPVLLRRRKGDTEYSLRAVPFAAFVRIVGMEPGEECQEGSIYQRPVAGRLLTILAGATMNFVLACLLLTTIGVVWGLGQGVTVLGFTDGSPALSAGLKTDDCITAVDGTEITSVDDLVRAIAPKGPGDVQVTVLREGQRQTYSVPTVSQKIEPQEASQFGLPTGATERSMIGFKPGVASYRTSAPPWAYLTHGVRETAYFTKETVGFVWRKIAGRSAPQEKVMGPLGIVQTVNEFVKLGIRPLLWLFAALNISIGIFNLLPIPMFDGGRFVIMAVEGARGKLFDKQKEAMVHLVGLMLIVIFAIAVSVSDVQRIRSGKTPLQEAAEEMEAQKQADLDAQRPVVPPAESPAPPAVAVPDQSPGTSARRPAPTVEKDD